MLPVKICEVFESVNWNNNLFAVIETNLKLNGPAPVYCVDNRVGNRVDECVSEDDKKNAGIGPRFGFKLHLASKMAYK